MGLRWAQPSAGGTVYSQSKTPFGLLKPRNQVRLYRDLTFGTSAAPSASALALRSFHPGPGTNMLIDSRETTRITLPDESQITCDRLHVSWPPQLKMRKM